MTLRQRVTWVASSLSRRTSVLKKVFLLVDEEQVAARWRRHLAELLHGQETMWSELAQVAREHAKTTHRKETNGFAIARCAVRPGEQESTQSDRPQWLSNLSAASRLRKQCAQTDGTAQLHSSAGHARRTRARVLRTQR